ncbi:hypothetical protein M9H77_31885 [Catharanthus roseus]|uniref:Uncharacterized protein n=1 Tax=Catharanthus roseus TaxID=4058 RepID=A0ACC0A5J7_CATRO|nr:hypothetical protein M9H77_31885 [Catharanthus roseus]
MPELGSDDLVMGSGLCPWSPTVALHVLLNLGKEAALMCLVSLRLPSCARNPHGWGYHNLIVGEDVAMHDVDEDSVSKWQIDEGDDLAGCNEIYVKRVVNDEKVAEYVKFDRPTR